jgi:acyl-CoA-binding protein
MATQKMPTIAKNLDAKAKLTLYSLYKQINEKDADEVPGNKDDMP